MSGVVDFDFDLRPHTRQGGGLILTVPNRQTAVSCCRCAHIFPGLVSLRDVSLRGRPGGSSKGCWPQITTHSLTHSLTHDFSHKFTYCLTTHSLTHLLTLTATSTASMDFESCLDCIQSNDNHTRQAAEAQWVSAATHALTHALTHTFTHLLTRSHIHHALAHTFTTHPLTHSHTLTYLFTHSLTHSLTIPS